MYRIMKKFSFHILYKDFGSGKMKSYDVMPSLYGSILTSKNTISKRWKDIYNITDFNSFRNFVNIHFRYCYWAKCEWEFIAQDWPPGRDGVDIKVDGYQQLEPNITLISELVWEQIKDKI